MIPLEILARNFGDIVLVLGPFSLIWAARLVLDSQGRGAGDCVGVACWTASAHPS